MKKELTQEEIDLIVDEMLGEYFMLVDERVRKNKKFEEKFKKRIRLIMGILGKLLFK